MSFASTQKEGCARRVTGGVPLPMHVMSGSQFHQHRRYGVQGSFSLPALSVVAAFGLNSDQGTG